MKTLLYAVACAGIGAAGILSYMKISMHQAELDATNQKEKQIITVENAYVIMQKEYDSEKELLAEAQDMYNNTKAEIELKESNKLTLNRTLKGLESRVVSQEEKLIEVSDLIAKIEAVFEGQEVEITEISDYVGKLNAERRGLEKENEELVVAIEEVQKKIDTNQADIAELNKREASRIANLRQNGISSLITAVNNGWGFVVIKPHPEAIITENSQLLIVRGAQHLGRLNINSVEANHVIADIDFDSLVAGARIRPGDRVILAKANSH